MYKALYYPYINIPSGPWLTQSLLYWDELNFIAPVVQYNLYNDHMKELINENLVIPCSPAKFVYNIGSFEEEFLNYIDNDDETKRRIDGIRNGDNYKLSKIHFQKLGPLAERLIERGIAMRSDNDWILLESRTAKHFMIYLATLIGYFEDYEPLTKGNFGYVTNERNLIHDNKKPVLTLDDIVVKHRPTMANSIYANERTMSHRELIIKNILPCPQRTLSANEIRRFKDKNQESIIKFRQYIEDFIIRYDSTTIDIRGKLLSSFIYEANLQREELSYRLKEFNITELTLFDFGVLGIGLYNALERLSEGDDKGAILQLSTLGLSVAKTIYSSMKDRNLAKREPLSYVVNYQKLINY